MSWAVCQDLHSYMVWMIQHFGYIFIHHYKKLLERRWSTTYCTENTFITSICMKIARKQCKKKTNRNGIETNCQISVAQLLIFLAKIGNPWYSLSNLFSYKQWRYLSLANWPACSMSSLAEQLLSYQNPNLVFHQFLVATLIIIYSLVYHSC